MHSVLKQFSATALALFLATVPAFGAGTGNVFVSNEKSHEVIVLSPDFEVIKSIQTDRRPRDMEFNDDQTRLYVACGDDDVIDVIDVEKLKVVDSIPTGPSPEVFAFSPDYSKIYVSNEEDSTLEVIDMDSRITTSQIRTGAEPEGVTVSADGKTAYVTSEVADLVHVVDTAKGVVTDNILVGTRPRRFVKTPDGKELWVSAELSSEVYVIDRATNKVIDSLSFVPPGFRKADVTPVGMAITDDGSKIIITLGRANHIAVVDTATRELISYVLVGDRAWSVALTADENTAVVANGLSDDITLVDMESYKPIRSIPMGRVPHTVVIDD